MSYANGTTHYNLPQTVGTDKRDWADPNQAFADIDAAIYGAVQDTAQAALDIDALEGRMDTAEQGISTNAGNIAGLDTRLTTAEGAITSQGAQITDTRQDLEDMICAYNEASATSTHAYAIGDYFIYNDVLYRAIQAIAIGDTIVPDTNCETTNVTTELLSTEDLSDDVQQLQTDVGQLQTSVSALTPSVLSTVDATSMTWRDALTALFSAVTIDPAKRLYIKSVTSNKTDFFNISEIRADQYSFTRDDYYYDNATAYYQTFVIKLANNNWGVMVQNVVIPDGGTASINATSISTQTAGATLSLIEY